MTETYIWLLAGLIAGMIVGYILGKIPQSWDGIFRIDLSDPEKDVFTLEVLCPLGELPTKKFVIFKVMNTRSQEKPFA